MDLELTLLGPPRLDCADGDESAASLGAKPLALLAFLALERGPHSRDELAALLWTDSPQDAARASLRQALRQLRQVSGEPVRADRKTVSLGAGVRCDAVAFLEAAAQQPEQAADYPADRFLSGFTLRHAAAFDEWTEAMRARLRQALRDALRAATVAAMGRSHWREAVGWAERWIACEPLSDDATRHAVEALYMTGDRGEALARYESFRSLIEEELGTEPSTALRELVRRIENAGGIEPIAAPPVDSGLPPQSFNASLVGREREWKSLSASWRKVTGGRGQTLLIEGESGIGKTRIAEDFLQWAGAGGATALRGQGYDPMSGIPFQPVADALRTGLRAPGLSSTAPEWLGEVARVLPELRDRFPNIPSAPRRSDPDRRGQLFEAVAQVFLGLASERPTILFVDDLQRCDADTCAMLHFLARRLDGAPVLLLATLTLGELDRDTPASRFCRTLRADTATAGTIRLAPLAHDHVWEIIRELGRITRPDGARRFAAQVHAVTDGNPFHILELLKALFTQGMLTVDEHTGEWAATPAVGAGPYQDVRMPRTVHDAVAGRCARLPYELRDLLATAAVAGRPVSSALLSHVHGVSRLRAAALADALVDRLLLTTEGGLYRSAHPIVRDVVREDLTPARRREVHRAIALALEQRRTEGHPEGAAGEIARHAERGGEAALAHRAALEASTEAASEERYEEALSWLEVAGQTAPSDEDGARVARRTDEILRAAGWLHAPPEARPAGTPARGFARSDLDLGTP